MPFLISHFLPALPQLYLLVLFFVLCEKTDKRFLVKCVPPSLAWARRWP